MNFTVTGEQKEFRREIIRFVKNNLNDGDALEEFSFDMWEKISRFGLLGITVSEEYGGLNESYETAAMTFETLGYACKNNGFIFAVANHVWVAQNILYLYGSSWLKDKYLHDMTSGKKIGSMAMTEANSGSDAMNMASNAHIEDGCYVLNGGKMFISNGPIADVFIVFAVTGHQPDRRLTAFVIDKEFSGVRIGKTISKMGLGACPACELVFDNVRVPFEHVLGNPDGGKQIMLGAVEWERCFEFAPHVGAMQRIMEECCEQARGRMQFGKPIAEYQAISHKIADMRVAVEMAKQMLYKIAWLKDNKRSAYCESAIFKLYVSENYINTCRDAMQIYGAYGYSSEYGVEKEMRDALASSIYSGTNEIQRNTIFSMTM